MYSYGAFGLSIPREKSSWSSEGNLLLRIFKGFSEYRITGTAINKNGITINRNMSISFCIIFSVVWLFSIVLHSSCEF